MREKVASGQNQNYYKAANITKRKTNIDVFKLNQIEFFFVYQMYPHTGG